jgi:hypothetical protein
MAKDLKVLVADLNRSDRAADNVKLGDVLRDLIANFNALLAKLDGDTGVNATNHAATLAVAKLEDR